MVITTGRFCLSKIIFIEIKKNPRYGKLFSMFVRVLWFFAFRQRYHPLIIYASTFRDVSDFLNTYLSKVHSILSKNKKGVFSAKKRLWNSICLNGEYFRVRTIFNFVMRWTIFNRFEDRSTSICADPLRTSLMWTIAWPLKGSPINGYFGKSRRFILKEDSRWINRTWMSIFQRRIWRIVSLFLYSCPFLIMHAMRGTDSCTEIFVRDIIDGRYQRCLYSVIAGNVASVDVIGLRIMMRCVRLDT